MRNLWHRCIEIGRKTPFATIQSHETRTLYDLSVMYATLRKRPLLRLLQSPQVTKDFNIY